MSRLVWNLTKLLSLTLMVAAVGCNKPTEGPTTEEQAQAAADRINDLKNLYEQENLARIAAEDEAERLRAERDKLAAQLANMPEAQPGQWMSINGGAMISIEGTVLFDSGKNTLKATGKQTLNDVARVLRDKYPDHDIYVFGHTDSQPILKSGWKDNYELSCERALSVVRHFKGRGLGQFVAACGWGQYRPADDNASTTGRQANRRVEVFALAPEKPISGSASTR